MENGVHIFRDAGTSSHNKSCCNNVLHRIISIIAGYDHFSLIAFALQPE